MPPLYTIRLVRNRRGSGPRIIVEESADAARVFSTLLENCDREYVAVMTLDTKGQVIGVTTVSVGTIDASIVRPADVYKPAIAANAASIIVAHNHPSGDPTPSPEDHSVTRQLKTAGKLLGVELLDHLVIGEGGSFRSLMKVRREI